MLRTEIYHIADDEMHYMFQYGVNVDGLSDWSAQNRVEKTKELIEELDVIKHLQDTGVRYSIFVHPIEPQLDDHTKTHPVDPYDSYMPLYVDTSLTEGEGEDKQITGLYGGSDIASVNCSTVSLVENPDSSCVLGECNSSDVYRVAVDPSVELFEDEKGDGAETSLDSSTLDSMQTGMTWDDIHSVVKTRDVVEENDSLPWVDESSLKGLSD